MYKRNGRRELVHLTYDASTMDPRGYVRGRASLPKRLRFKEAVPHVCIRQDLKPSPGENHVLFQEAMKTVGQRDSWQYAASRKTLTCRPGNREERIILGEVLDGAIRLSVKRDGSPLVGILIAANRKANKGKCCIPADESGHIIIRDLETGDCLDYGTTGIGRSKEYEVVMIRAGEHLEIYVNDSYIGTMACPGSFREIGILVSGNGKVTIRRLGFRALP